MARSVRYALAVAALFALACGGKADPEVEATPEPLPFPTMAFAGQNVALYPLTIVAAEPELGWDAQLRPREAALQAGDSVIALFLTERTPEVEWVLPDALRQAADRAPGMLPDPDHMGTGVLRAEGIDRIPDPLASELRNLTGVAADRWAAIPASLVFRQAAEGNGRAELTLLVVDARRGRVAFRTVASGEGDDPWSALWDALTTLVPDLP